MLLTWWRKLVNRKAKNPSRPRRGPSPRRWAELCLERLEDRLTPATVTDGGTSTLSIVLGTNESLAIMSNGSTYTFTSNQSITNGGVANPSDFSGFGSPSLMLLASGIARYTTAISITDSGPGDTVTFDDSGTNTYANNFTVALGDPAAGQITFNGSSTFSGSNALSASTTADVVINGSVSSTLGSITASGATISESGSGGISTTGTVSLTAASSITQTAGPVITAGTLNVTAGSVGTSGQSLVLDATSLTSDTSAGNGDQFLADTATVALTSANALNAGTGTITLTGGTFQVQNSNAIPSTATVAVISPAILDLDGNSVTLSGLIGSGGVINSSATNGALTLNVPTSDTFVGVLGGGASDNNFSLTLNAGGTTGTLTLSASNTYTGPTDVDAGTLYLGTTVVVPNYSFETPSIGAGNYQYNPTGGSWTFAGNSGIAANGSPFNNANAPDGGQVAFIQITGSISQSIDFPVDGTYVLNFQSAFRNAQNGVNDFMVQVDGNTVGTFTPTTFASYLPYSTNPFFVSAGSHTIQFTGIDSLGGDRTSFVDNVSISVAASPTNILSPASAVTVAAGGTLNLGGNNETIGSLAGAGTVLLGSGTLTTGANNTSTSFAGIISGSGGLTKIGTGTFTFSGLGTYTGDTTVNAGTLQLAQGTIPGGAVAEYTFNGNTNDVTGNGNDGTISGSGTSFVPGPPQLGGQGLHFSGSQAVTVPYSAAFGLNSYTVSAWVDMDPGFASFTNGILGTRFGGPDETFDVKVQGSGIHGDVGDGSNWINTGVDIPNAQGGQLTAGTWALVTYVIDNTAQQFQLYVNGVLLNTIPFSGTPLFMQPGQTLEIGDSSDGEFMNGAIADVFIYGRALDQFEIDNLFNPNHAALPSGTNVSVASGANLDLNGISPTIGSLNGSGNVIDSGSAATLTVTGGGSFAGVISGPNTALTVSGPGQTLTLSGSNTYGGATNVLAGTLYLGNTFLVPDYSFETPSVGTYQYNPTGSSWTFNGSSGLAANGSAFNNANAPDGTQVAFIQTTGSISQSIDFPADGTYVLNFESAFRNAQNGVNDFEVQVDGNTVGTFTPTTFASYLSYSTNPFTVTAGSHTVEFLGLDDGGGDRTSFVDNVSITERSANNILPATSAVTVAADGTLNLAGNNQTIGSLAGAGTVLLGAGTLTTGANNSSTNFDGLISGSGGLTKIGTGTFTFSGLGTYTGSTTVNAGTLQLADVPPAGAVAEYTFNGNTNDVTGNGHDGTISGSGTTYVPGPPQLGGQGLHFSGSQAVTVPYSSAFGLNNYTVSAWVDMDSGFGSFLNGILGTRFGPDNTFDLKVTGGGIHGDVGNGSNWINTGVDIPNAQGGQLTAGTWAMVTYVIDNTAQQFQLYVNGSLLNAIPFSGTPLFMQPGQTLEIGDSSGGEYMNGAIADVFIYGRALGQGEIDNLFSLSNPVLPNGTNVSVASGANLDLNGISPTIGSLNGSGDVIDSSSTATLTVIGGGSFAGAISGTNTALTVNGVSQTLTLSGTNTYAGPTNVLAGTLSLGSTGAGANASDFTVAAGSTLNLLGNNATVGSLAGAGTVLLGSGTLTTGANNNSTSFAGLISGLGGLTKVGTGTSTFSGSGTYGGSTTVNAGTLQLANGTPAGAVAEYTFNGNTNDGTGNGNDGTLVGSGTSYVAGPPQLGGQALNFTGSQAVTVPYSSVFGLNSYTVSAWVDMDPGFASFTNGILGTRFGLDDTFDLKVQASGIHGDVGDGSNWINTSVDIPNGQGGQLTAGTWAMVTYVIDNTADLFQLYVNGVLLNTIPFSGMPLFMQPGQTLEIGDSSDGEYMNGAIADVFIYGQALSQAQVDSLLNASSTVLPSGTNVAVASGASLDLNGLSPTIGSLNGSGNVIDSGSTATLTVTGGGSFAGAISGGGTALTVNGSGQTLILSGTNTYAGVTTVNAGTLQVNGTLSSTASTTVNSGGTLDGTGSISSNVTVSSGGTISPGTVGTVGTLTAGSLTFNGGTYQGDLDPTSNTADEIVVPGSVNLMNTAQGTFNLNVLNGGTPTPGAVYTLIDNTGSGAILNPPLANAIDGSSTSINGSIAFYSYSGGNGQSFTLKVAAAPAITSANNATFTAGVGGTFTVMATGYPTPTLAETATLPSGVTFNTSNGNLTVSTSAANGIYNLTFTASNGIGTPASQSFTLTVGTAPTITSANNATFTAGVGGTFTVMASGFPTPTFAETAPLPSGVTFNTTTGALGVSSTTADGTYNLSFTASNVIGTSASQSFTLTVGTAPAITSANNATFTAGVGGTFMVMATGYPAPTFAATPTLPSGVTFNTTTGALGVSSTTADGTYNLSFTASNVIGTSASQSFTLTVGTAPVITSANSASFAGGTGGTFTVMASGFPTPTFAATPTLPSGVTFNTTTGALDVSSTTADGTYNLSFTASNVIGTSASQSFTLNVFNPTLATGFMITPSTTSATAGQGLTFTVTAVNGLGTTATGYVGTVTFSSTDHSASFFPSSYTFIPGDNGSHTFYTTSVMFFTTGTQTITATDSAHSLSGTSAAILVSSGSIPQLLKGPAFYDVSAAEASTGQRSMIDHVQLNYGSPLPTGYSFAVTTLAGYSGVAAMTPVTVSAAYSGGTYTLSFSGKGVGAGGSLLDGVYSLQLLGPGNTSTTLATFFRLFGDANGDARVDGVDLATFQAAVGSSIRSANYKAYLDYDSNNVINSTDEQQFGWSPGATNVFEGGSFARYGYVLDLNPADTMSYGYLVPIADFLYPDGKAPPKHS